MQNCPPIELLQRLLDEDLSAEAAAAFEAHLQMCPSCEDRLDQLASISRDSLPPSGLVLSVTEEQ
ncbi:MAG TPA: zf-HC2 domain-containing protein, partial [Gemmataceae bacterium]|nr:zf-HC2 domain-containing protein [Gemmataceae bacterium]